MGGNIAMSTRLEEELMSIIGAQIETGNLDDTVLHQPLTRTPPPASDLPTEAYTT